MYSEIFGKVDQNSYYRTTCKLGCLLDVSGTDRKEVRFFSPFLGKNRRTFFDLLDVFRTWKKGKEIAVFSLHLLFDVLDVSGNERREIRS